MNFTKLQATGNDFILIDDRASTHYKEGEYRKNLARGEPRWAELARAICQRHFGIGADGLILVQDSQDADLKMRVFNPDGSEAEACGNGIRCFTKYVIERGIYRFTSHIGQSGEAASPPPSPELSIETLSGIRKVTAYMSENRVSYVQASMGMPQFQPEQIPINLGQTPSTEDSSRAQVKAKQAQPILNYSLIAGVKELTLSILSMGNPHAVSFLSEPVSSFPLSGTGPIVERHPLFPRRTNFEIARVLSRGKIEARVWERGVGETLACGSGACAIAVAAQLLDYIDTQADIVLPGGTLAVSWRRGEEVLLAGQVEEVFTGEYPG